MKKTAATLLMVIVYVLSPGFAGQAAADSAHYTERLPEGKALECLWTLSVDQTVETELNGYAFTGTLTVIAVKLGGTDEYGMYTGTVHLQYAMHMARGSVSGDATGQGQDLYAAIEVVPYTSAAFDAAGGLPELTELVAYGAMALGEFLLTGTGDATQTSGGASWSTQDSKAVPAPYRMSVDGGQVRLELYTVLPGVVFTGMITGEPIE